MLNELPKSVDLAKAMLRRRNGEEFAAGELWDKQPVVLMLIRRPGCVLWQVWTRKAFPKLRFCGDDSFLVPAVRYVPSNPTRIHGQTGQLKKLTSNWRPCSCLPDLLGQH